MRTGKQIQKMWNVVYDARNKYVNAVGENLKEIGGELETVSDYWEEDSGEPKGVHISYFNGMGEASECVVDKVRFDMDTPITRIGFHVCYEDDTEQDYWACNSDFDTDSEMMILSYIQWPK